MRDPFRYFNSSPEVFRLVVMMYIRYPLSLRQVEDVLFERGIDICYETVRFWWNRFDPMFAAEIRKRALSCMDAPVSQGKNRGRPYMTMPAAHLKYRFAESGAISNNDHSPHYRLRSRP